MENLFPLQGNIEVHGEYDEDVAKLVNSIGIAYDLVANKGDGIFIELGGEKIVDIELVYRIYKGISFAEEVKFDKLVGFKEDVFKKTNKLVDFKKEYEAGTRTLSTSLAWIGSVEGTLNGIERIYLTLIDSPTLYRYAKGEDIFDNMNELNEVLFN